MITKAKFSPWMTRQPPKQEINKFVYAIEGLSASVSESSQREDIDEQDKRNKPRGNTTIERVNDNGIGARAMYGSAFTRESGE
jgi:hypothetical protein